MKNNKTNALKLRNILAIALVAVIGFSIIACDDGTKDVPVTGVTLNQSSISLTVGGSATLTATVAPDNATNKAVIWSTSDAAKVTVANGVVTAVAEGSAVITVTTADGGKTAICSVTVINGISSTPDLSGTITISPSTEVNINTELTANYSGTETVSYQWRKGDAIVGTNSNKYTPTTAGGYTVTVSAEGYNSKTSAVVDVNDPSLSTLSGTVTISPTAVIVNTELTATYSGSEAVSFQWGKDGSNIGTASTTKPNKYTPTTAGSYTVTVSLEGYNSKTSNAVTVSQGTPPTITTATLPDGAGGTWYSQTLAATGSEPITWTLDSGTLPYGFDLWAIGVIIGQLPWAGTFTFTVKATNAAGSDTKQLSITIVEPPTITTGTLPRGTAGTAYNQTLTATGTAPITWSLDDGTLPAGLILEATGAITGTPTTTGTSTFTVKATNAVGNEAREFSIYIAPDPSNITSVSDFRSWSYSQPANTPATAYTVKINVSDLSGNIYTSGSLGYVLRTLTNNIDYETIYVNLDLSGSTFTDIPGDSFHGAFEECDSLVSITLPNSVTSIGDRAFQWCRNLTSVTIGNGVTSIESAFAYCIGLKSVTFTATSKVTSIGRGAFSQCTSLTDITIPNSVTSIEYLAFGYCASLTDITIPDSVTSIGDGAFRGCESLASITIPFVGNTLNGTSDTRFGYIFGAEKDDDQNYYIPSSLKTVVITGGNSIEQYAFGGCTGLTSVTIPDSVTSIGGNAFYGCTSLTSITIPDSVTSIGTYAFGGCTGLTSVTLPANASFTTIRQQAFNGCTSLTSVTIPNSVTTIEYYAFYGCTGLTSITIPFVGYTLNGTSNTHFGYIFGSQAPSSSNSFTQSIPASLKTVIITGGNSIGENAFRGCTGLTGVTIPDSVTSIVGYAFEGCADLSITWHYNPALTAVNFKSFVKTVIIPNSVTSIGNEAFYGCAFLVSITIPNSVTSVGQNAFFDCTSLNSVTFQGTITSSNFDSFAFGTSGHSVGDLREKYLASNGGIGTYTRPDTGLGGTWTKQ